MCIRDREAAARRADAPASARVKLLRGLPELARLVRSAIHTHRGRNAGVTAMGLDELAPKINHGRPEKFAEGPLVERLTELAKIAPRWLSLVRTSVDGLLAVRIDNRADFACVTRELEAAWRSPA